MCGSRFNQHGDEGEVQKAYYCTTVHGPVSSQAQFTRYTCMYMFTCTNRSTDMHAVQVQSGLSMNA